MPVIDRLFEVYEGAGFTVSTGLNPHHVGGYLGAPFTFLLQDGKSFSNGLGIALKEVYFLECLLAKLRPARAFLIGNSFGWSTLAVAFCCPSARVVAIDACFDENSDKGLTLTNELGRAAGLNVAAVRALSPDNVDAVVKAELGGAIDFCLIDGLHTDEQVVQDFAAVEPLLAPGALVLFHDVINCRLQGGMSEIRRRYGREPVLLYGTSSGMAVLYYGEDAGVLRTLKAFAGSPQAISLMKELARDERWPRLRRLRRSLHKRLAEWGF